MHFPQIEIRTMLRMSDVEATLRRYKVFKTPPCRNTLIAYIEAGELEGTFHRGRHYVYEDSLTRWIQRFQRPVAA